MFSPYQIGIDIGTGSVKAVAVDDSGRVISSERAYYASAVGHERDAAMLFDVFIQCLQKLVQKTASSPAGITLSSMMHSIMAVKENGEPMSDLFLWSDLRSHEIAESLRTSEPGQKIYRATGTPLHAMSPLCKIKWLYQTQPGLFHKTYKFISIKEYIWFRLFGEFRIDHSVASATGLFDIHSRAWNKEALSFIPLEGEKLSLPVPTNYNRVGLDRSIAGRIGISEDTPFCIGASDGCLANLGSLCLEPSVAAITVGTSAAVRITTGASLSDAGMMPFSYILDKNNFVCGGAVSNGGNIIQWLCTHFLELEETDQAFRQLYHEIAQSPPGAAGLLFLPYLNGERAPVWDEKSSGVFFGIKTEHKRQHFLRAAIEGVCFSLADNLFTLEKMSGPVKEVRVSGAVTESKTFLQILADIINKPVRLQQSEDASALGASYLGLNCFGFIKDYADIKENNPVYIKPVSANAALYRKSMRIFQQLYPALKSSMHDLSNDD
jgi:gluconokinase